MYTSAILIYGVIVCFLGVVVVFLVYYFWRVHSSSDFDYHTSVKSHQKVGEEKREHSRANINWPVSMETAGGTTGAEVKNISIGGAFICCKNPLPLGEVFRLTMTGPDNELVAATAAVVWSNANVPEDKVINRGMGVRFIKMSDRHIQLVRQIFQESG
jgi:uncharacterized protein (TIGR02266 family)